MGMLETTQNLPGDIAELQAILAVRDEEIAAGKAEIRVRDLLIEKLKHQLAGMRENGGDKLVHGSGGISQPRAE